jgi:hypothetical protein
MAISRKRGTSGFAPSPIDAAWRPILEALNAYDGRTVVRLLREAADQSTGTWNACRARLDAWLESWFRDRGFGVDPKFPGEDFSRDALVSFLRDVNQADDVLTIDAIPRILTELRLFPSKPEALILAPPAAVRRAVGRVVPGNLYEPEGGTE